MDFLRGTWGHTPPRTGPCPQLPRTFGAWALDLENQNYRQDFDGIQILSRPQGSSARRGFSLCYFLYIRCSVCLSKTRERKHLNWLQALRPYVETACGTPLKSRPRFDALAHSRCPKRSGTCSSTGRQPSRGGPPRRRDSAAFSSHSSPRTLRSTAAMNTRDVGQRGLHLRGSACPARRPAWSDELKLPSHPPRHAPAR